MNYDIQKASMLRRVPAWLLDIILVLVLATGFMAGLSYVLDLDAHIDQIDAVYDRYEKEYDVSFDLTDEDYEKLTEEDLARYEAASEALSKDTEAQKTYELVLNLTLVTVSGGFLGALLILEFLIPLWLKNGQTLGKKVFGIGLMRKDGIKVTTFMLFVRAVLGKFTIETMIPIFLLLASIFGILGLGGLILCLAALLIPAIVALVTRNKTAIHDLMACTIAVDLGSQMIFDTPEEQLEYYKQLHEENAAQADY